MLRYLTERLPRWCALAGCVPEFNRLRLLTFLTYLEQSLFVCRPGVYEIGGAEVTTYREMISEYARARGLHARFIVTSVADATFVVILGRSSHTGGSLSESTHSSKAWSRRS